MKKNLFLFFCFINILLFLNDAKSQDGNKIIFKDGKYGMSTTYNNKTLEIIKPKLEDIKHVYKNCIYKYKENGKWGFMVVYTFKHEVYRVGAPEFDDMIFLKELQHSETGFYLGSTAYFLVKKGDKTAFLNFQFFEAPQKFNISPYFDEIGSTADSMKLNIKKLFYVKKDGLYGLYNPRGIEKCPIEYKTHEQYTNDNGIVFHTMTKDDGNYIFVDNLIGSYPFTKAQRIWYDTAYVTNENNDTLSFKKKIYLTDENNDTLTYQGGKFKSIKIEK